MCEVKQNYTDISYFRTCDALKEELKTVLCLMVRQQLSLKIA